MWLRLYTEIRHDRKLRRLPPAQRWLWITMLTIAKESPSPGWLLLSEGVPVTVEDLADEAAISVDEVKTALEVFVNQNMLEEIDGVWHLKNWDKRQFTSDSSTERVERYRQKVRSLGMKVSGYEKHKEAIFERDGYRCVYCGSEENLCVDHVVPLTMGGSDDLDNLVCACKKCNSGKAGRTPELAGYTFVNKSAEERYRNYLKRLQLKPVTVTDETETVSETPPETEYRVQSTDTETETETEKGKESCPHPPGPDPSPDPQRPLDDSQEEPKYTNDSPSYRAALYLRNRILGNNPRARVPPDDPKDKLMQNWAEEMDKLNRIGPPGAQNCGYTWEEIRQLIDWCQNDEFWYANILSPGKLRKQVVTLENQMKRQLGREPPKKGRMAKNVENALRLVEKYQAEDNARSGVP